MLITHRCFSCCWAGLTLNQGHVSISNCPAREEAGSSQKLGRGHSRAADSQLTRGISHTFWHYDGQLNWGRVGRGLAACCPETGWTLVSSWWAIVHHLFSIFFYHYFPFFFCPIKLLLSQPMSFNFFQILCPGTGVGEWVTVWCLASCQVKPQHLVV